MRGWDGAAIPRAKANTSQQIYAASCEIREKENAAVIQVPTGPALAG
jgi:hypothetical protein